MHKLEVQVSSVIVKVTPYIWRSWTGRRWKDGMEYHGPIFLLGSNEYAPDTQARACPCCDRRDRVGRFV